MTKLLFSQFKQIMEASYTNNLGFEELVSFYKKATPKDEKEMESILDKNDWVAFKKLIKRVLGITLK